MSTVPGQDAKDKGNAAFKSGDFPAAIGHYTAAILADPKNPTYPLNRAAAYLKLGKHEDAERDCDMTIKLDPKNVKAWFRRGQARAGTDRLQGAKDDFKRTLQLDPANEAAKQELAKVEALLQYRANNVGKKRTPIDVTVPSTSRPAPSSTSTSASGSTPKRRRVPIKIVDNAPQASTSTSPPAPAKADVKAKGESKEASVTYPGSNTEGLMKPVSTRTLTPTTTTSTPPAPAPSKTTSFKDLKQAREASKHSQTSVSSSAPAPLASSPPPSATPPRVTAGGGIFRSNGQHTIFGSSAHGTENTKGQASSAPKPAPSVNGQGPMTLFAFNKAWAMIDSPERKWDFLIDNVPASSLPAMFKTSLEAPLLVSMLETFKFVLTEHDDERTIKDSVKSYLLNLARVPRFSTIIMFMSNDEKKLVKEVWDGVSRTDDQVEVGVRKVWGVL